MAAPPTTAYLLWGEQCLMGCAFCPQSHRNSKASGFLGRINWPAFTYSQLAEGLAGAEAAGLKRICLQGVRGPEGAAPLLAMLWKIKGQSPLPICVSTWIDSVSEVAALLAAGADRISIALDAATPPVYRRVKGGSFEERWELLLTSARRWPGRIATHIIVGLGETEEEALRLMDSLYREQVTVALFAFTPLKGTPLAGHPPPEISSYRRIQAASYLLEGKQLMIQRLCFQEGKLVALCVPKEKLKDLLRGGKAFETRGCLHCNRPFYNERPGSVLYNYPRPLTRAEEEAALNCLGLSETEGTVPFDSPRPSRDNDSQSGTKGNVPSVPHLGNPMRETWRVIHDPPMSGQDNMERDLALHREVSRGDAPPTLRFYRWDPPAVSLGRFQKAEEVVDTTACRRLGIDVVRRPTGGRALLHHRELTYSLVVPESHPLIPSSVLGAYKVFSLALIRGLEGMGIRAALAPGDNRGRGLAPGACFDTPSAYEIQIDGKKVVGSAQMRRDGVLLQHGAVLLRLSLDLYQEILKPAAGPGSKDAYLASLGDRAAGLEDLGYQVDPEALASALQAGFGRALNVDFVTYKGV